MKTHISYLANRRQSKHGKLPKLYILSISLLLGIALRAQETIVYSQSNIVYTRPIWWFGASGAANFNIYNGKTASLAPGADANPSLNHGFGVGGYGSVMAEFRPDPVWGAMLNVAYDNRYGTLGYYNAGSNVGTENVDADFAYISIEPSLRIAPGGGNFYIFLGPTIGFNVQKSFMFKQPEQPTLDGNFWAVNSTVYSGQVGVGYDFSLSAYGSKNQWELSPFAAYTPSFGNNDYNEIRTVNSLNLATIRVGVALKFGRVPKPIIYEGVVSPAPAVPDVAFSFTPPPCVPMQQTIKESFPLRNFVFFNAGSNEIPNRYTTLSPSEAANFNEDEMQNSQSTDTSSRSARQLTVYRNIINIVGDRMRKNSDVTITLVGSSGGEGAENGKLLAENIKTYLVNNFGIDGSRIMTVGRNRPINPSRQSYTTQQFDLVDAEDRRVDITSNSPEILAEYSDNSSMLKPAQITSVSNNVLGTNVFFYAPGADSITTSWWITISDEKGNAQDYGPFHGESENISLKTIMGNKTGGVYKIVFTGDTKNGGIVTRENTMDLTCKTIAGSNPPETKYSILFDFDKSTTAEYSDFLASVVAPSINANSTVIIQGYTDIVGQDDHNMELSKARAQAAELTLEQAMKNEGKQNVTFQTIWSGADTKSAPFGNVTPEERFYNRTVVIKVLPGSQPVAVH